MSLEKIAATVIGGGVVGLACALKLTEKFGSGNVALLEKNSKFGTEQSGRSSEVIHSGINNEGLKLDLCVKAIGNFMTFVRSSMFHILNVVS